jgi:hypothetical protein
MLDVSLVLEYPTDGIAGKGHDEVLERDWDARNDAGVISEIIDRISHEVDEIHPSELVGAEELHGTCK